MSVHDPPVSSLLAQSDSYPYDKQWAQDAPKCPGFYEEEEDLRKGKSKSALKNEKRKQKKQQERSEGLDASPATVVDAATERISQMKITEVETASNEMKDGLVRRAAMSTGSP